MVAATWDRKKVLTANRDSHGNVYFSSHCRSGKSMFVPVKRYLKTRGAEECLERLSVALKPTKSLLGSVAVGVDKTWHNNFAALIINVDCSSRLGPHEVLCKSAPSVRD